MFSKWKRAYKVKQLELEKKNCVHENRTYQMRIKELELSITNNKARITDVETQLLAMGSLKIETKGFQDTQ